MPTYKVRVYEAYDKTFILNAKTQDDARKKIEDKGAMYFDKNNDRSIQADKSKIEEFRIEEVEEIR
jgi:hypothetical protein